MIRTKNAQNKVIFSLFCYEFLLRKVYRRDARDLNNQSGKNQEHSYPNPLF